jgi:hypothetical protein
MPDFDPEEERRNLCADVPLKHEPVFLKDSEARNMGEDQ